MVERKLHFLTLYVVYVIFVCCLHLLPWYVYIIGKSDYVFPILRRFIREQFSFITHCYIKLWILPLWLRSTIIHISNSILQNTFQHDDTGKTPATSLVFVLHWNYDSFWLTYFFIHKSKAKKSKKREIQIFFSSTFQCRK